MDEAAPLHVFLPAVEGIGRRGTKLFHGLIRRNGYKLNERSFTSEVRKKFCTQGGEALPTAVGAPLLKMFKARLDRAPGSQLTAEGLG